MLDPTLEEQELLADTLERDHAGLTRAELTAAVLDTAGFLLVVGVLVLIAPPHGFSVTAALASSVVLVAATRVQFDTPFGFTVPVQLGFVPLLFSVPAPPPLSSASRGDSRPRQRHRHRRLRHARLRQRPAVHLQGRARTLR